MRPGAIIPRGALVTYAQSPVTGQLSCFSALNTNNGWVFTPSAGPGLVEPWAAAYSLATATQVAGATGQVYVATNDTDANHGQGKAAAFSLAAALAPGPQRATVGPLVYSLSYGNGYSTNLPISGSGYTIASTQLLAIDASLNFHGAGSNAPIGGVGLAVYQNRVWIAQGIDPGAASTALHSATVLYFTVEAPDLANSTFPIPNGGFALNDWKDPVSGLINKIVIDGDNTDPIMALTPIRSGLLILRYKSIWLLRGNTTSNYSLTRISRASGCADARAWVNTDEGVFFLGSKGLMLTDGSRVQNVGGSMMYTLRRVMAYLNSFTNSGTYGTYTCLSVTSDGSLVATAGLTGKTYGGVTAAAPRLIPVMSMLYDSAAKGGAWSRITTQLAGYASPVNTGSGNADPTLLGPVFGDQGGQRAAVVATTDTSLIAVERLNTASGGVPCSVSAGIGSLFDVASILPASGAAISSCTRYSIPAKWQSRYAPLIGTSTLTRKWSQPKRFFVDYQHGVDPVLGAGPEGSTGPVFVAYPVAASDGTFLGADGVTPVQMSLTPSLVALAAGGFITLPGSTSYVGSEVTPSPRIQRLNMDFNNEVTDLGFTVSLPTSNFLDTASVAPIGVNVAMYGIGVEFQPTRDLR